MSLPYNYFETFLFDLLVFLFTFIGVLAIVLLDLFQTEGCNYNVYMIPRHSKELYMVYLFSTPYDFKTMSFIALLSPHLKTF